MEAIEAHNAAQAGDKPPPDLDRLKRFMAAREALH